MKLQKFKEKDNQKVMIIVFSVCCILLIVGVIFYNSFALYEQKKDFNVINGNIVDSGDLNFAYYIDENITFSVPSKKEGYKFNSKSYCTNGVTVKWNYREWKAILDFANYKEEEEKIKCHIHFDTPSTGPAVTYILNSSETSDELVHDNTNEDNVRYVGKNPKNYVSFNNELWRIVGVFHDIKDENGNPSSRIKLIKSDGIGTYTWDSSSYNNDWSKADIMRLLNPLNEDKVYNNSLYWNTAKGQCKSSAFKIESCDFTKTGLTDEAKLLIDNVYWPLGGSINEINSTSSYYQNERGEEVAKKNAKEWLGYVGLMNPSDYGFATAGGDTTSREKCLETKLNDWGKNEVSDCKNNNWLFKTSSSFDTWTMHHQTSNSTNAFAITYSGSVGIVQPRCGGADAPYSVNEPQTIYPNIFLKENIDIISGDGTESNPYILYNSDWKNKIC